MMQKAWSRFGEVPYCFSMSCFVRRRNGGRQRNQPTLHAWKRTCHFKHCSYVIFTSNTDGIRGVSIVKTDCSYMSLSLPANISLRFCKHWYMCKYTATFIIIIIWAYGFLQGYIGWHSWLNIGKNRFYLKDVANGTRFFKIRMLWAFIII